jgi:hypothetical protein
MEKGANLWKPLGTFPFINPDQVVDIEPYTFRTSNGPFQTVPGSYVITLISGKVFRCTGSIEKVVEKLNDTIGALRLIRKVEVNRV